MSVSRNCFKVPNYIFMVKHFERESKNSGWLISSIEQCDEAKKIDMLNVYRLVVHKDTIRNTTIAEKVVRRFWDNLRMWVETQDVEYSKSALKECNVKACRISDKLMSSFSDIMGLPKITSYLLDSYLIGFQNLVINRGCKLDVVDIKQIDKDDQYDYVACTIIVSGSINCVSRDVFIIQKNDGNKISSIKPRL